MEHVKKTKKDSKKLEKNRTKFQFSSVKKSIFRKLGEKLAGLYEQEPFTCMQNFAVIGSFLNVVSYFIVETNWGA